MSMEQLAQAWGQFVTRHRLLTLAVSLVVTVCAALGGQHLSFTSDYRTFFTGDDPHLLAFENLQDTYVKNDNVLFVMAPRNGRVFDREFLAAVAEATDLAWDTPYSIRVDSLSNYQHTVAQGDDLTVSDLYEDAASLTPEDLDRIRGIAVKEPSLVHRLVSPEAHIAAINITVELPGEDEAREGPEVAAFVRGVKDHIENAHPEIRVYLTGIMMLNQSFPEAAIHDITHLMPVALGTILLLVFLQLRGLTGTVGTLVTIILSVACAMGVAGWMGIKLTPPSMSAPTIILTLAVADCVHVLTTWVQKHRAGMGRREAMAESLRINFSPVFLTSVTTAIGFLALNFSEVPPFRNLGNISAAGVMFAWWFSVTTLPALVTLLPVSRRKRREYGTEIITRFADWVIRRRGMLMPVMCLLIIGLIAAIPRNELNDVFVDFMNKPET